MKIYVKVVVTSPIDVPDCWENPDNPQEILDVADYHFNDKLESYEVAMDELSRLTSPYKDQQNLKISFSREEPQDDIY